MLFRTAEGLKHMGNTLDTNGAYPETWTARPTIHAEFGRFDDRWYRRVRCAHFQRWVTRMKESELGRRSEDHCCGGRMSPDARRAEQLFTRLVRQDEPDITCKMFRPI